MRGPPKPRRLDEPIAVSLEALIPADHVYRQLEAALDLGFVREWARNLYAECARPSIDPVIFFNRPRQAARSAGSRPDLTRDLGGIVPPARAGRATPGVFSTR
ncbi:MAG: hypothetical protein H0W06_12785 [Chloroflexia bacterium]|nr:hypothetical protein [Chloroflexia bacterium]